jgi:hypothetical protein
MLWNGGQSRFRTDWPAAGLAVLSQRLVRPYMNIYHQQQSSAEIQTVYNTFRLAKA